MTTKTLQQRAEIEAAIEGRTLCDQLQVTAERSGDAPALSDVGESGTQTITWAQAREQALRLAAGFIALGLQPGELSAPEPVKHRPQFREPVGSHPVPAAVPLRPHADQIRLAQHLEVLRRRGPG